jgi:para-aminobenzoate synthetase component 1
MTGPSDESGGNSPTWRIYSPRPADCSLPVSGVSPFTPLVEELIPAPDPWAVARKFAHLPHLLFLDSAEPRPERGRYSYVTADPGRLLVVSPAQPAEDVFGCHCFACDPVRRPHIPDLPPFIGGWAGLFGYHLGRAFERQPPPRQDEFQAPDLVLGVYDWVISFDRQTGRAWLVSTGVMPEDPALEQQEIRAAARLDVIKDILENGPRPGQEYGLKLIPPDPSLTLVVPRNQHPLHGFSGVTSNFDRAGYEAAVRRVVEYIRAGDCFQVNLAQRLLAPFAGSPLELYGQLRERNPAPFAGYFDLGEFAIASASPERFLKLSSTGDVETRPIKGTRPRGRTPTEDEANRQAVLASPKDRAENVMIVDLLRNDLGRVCEFGSVQVAKLCELESYRTVHHLVSEVVGKLRPGMTAFDLLRAAFPGGSITGAPKVRAMEIIAELEPTARGPYCGSLGYIGFDGAMDTNILIRTFTLGRGWAQFPVGGGIVADSDPAGEYEETLHKAAGLLSSLE